MAELDPVVPGEPVDSSTFGNPVIDRVLSRYDNAADRDVAVPLPVPGDFAYLTQSAELQVFDGSVWQSFMPVSGGTFQGSVRISDGEHLNIGQAAVGGDLLKLQGDGGEDTGRRYRFRRGAAFGSMEFVAVNSDDTEKTMFLFNAATATVASSAIFDATTGTAANVNIDATDGGRLRQSTSARRFKSDIEPAAGLEGVTLEPVTFLHDDGDRYLGFIADDLADQHELVGVYDAEGDIVNYDLRAIVAVLAAKVNDLEERLAALEGK